MPHAGSRPQACLQGYQKMASWCFCEVLPNNFATTWIRFHVKTLLSVPGFWTVSHVHAILLGRERHYVQDSESGLSCHFHTWWWMLSHENLMCLDLHWSSTFSYKLVKFMNKHRNLRKIYPLRRLCGLCLRPCAAAAPRAWILPVSAANLLVQTLILVLAMLQFLHLHDPLVRIWLQKKGLKSAVRTSCPGLLSSCDPDRKIAMGKAVFLHGLLESCHHPFNVF